MMGLSACHEGTYINLKCRVVLDYYNSLFNCEFNNGKRQDRKIIYSYFN